MWILKVIILSLILLVTASITLSTLYGHHVLFKPSRKMFYTPSSKFTEFTIKGVNGRYFNNYPGKRTILYCHGNNDNITERKYIIDIADDYNLNLLIFDYQGFGKSSGTPYQYSLQPDAQTAYDYLMSQKVNPDSIVIWGESLGCNPAVYLAETNKCGALVVMSGFSSIEDAIGDYPGSIWKVCQKMYKYIFDPSVTTSRICHVKVPVIIVHSTDDEMIPFQSAERLFDAVRSSKKLIKIKGSHGEPKFDPEVLKRSMKYLCDGDFSLKEIPI